MQFLSAYVLKLALCLALGYLFYIALLRRMTWYSWNRYFLLFFSLLSLVIPVLPVQLPASMPAFNTLFFVTESVKHINQNTQSNIVSNNRNIIGIAWLVFFAGMIFCLVRFAIRFAALYRTRSAARLINNGDVKLYHLENCAAPFSFHNSIYLDTNQYDEADLEKIIEHELVHITQHHTIDTILAELICVIQWFNPFVWMMKNAMRQNLEFIADDVVLQKGINRKNYQYLLLKVSGAIPYSLANNLLFPSLKKRIYMMNRTKTSRIHLLRFMCVVPLACVLLFSFSGSTGKIAPANSSDAFSLGTLSFYINDATVAALLKKEQVNSYLRAGGPLSLSLISEEKARIKTLLEKNGYDNLNNHAITFVMDTSSASHSFSVQVTIQLDKDQKNLQQFNKNPVGISTANLASAEKETQFIIAPGEKQQQNISPMRTQQTVNPARNAADHSVAMK